MLRLRGEETGLRAEVLLATPVRRLALAGSHAIIAGAAASTITGHRSADLASTLTGFDTARHPFESRPVCRAQEDVRACRLIRLKPGDRVVEVVDATDGSPRARSG